MPTPVDSLYLIGEVSLVLTGFAGTVMALNRRPPDQWAKLERMRITLLFGCSVSALSFALIGIGMMHAGIDAALTWRIISASGAFDIAVLCVSPARIIYTTPRDDPQQAGLIWSNSLFAMLAVVFVAQVWNVAVGHTFWPVFLMLGSNLVAGAIIFAFLLFRYRPASVVIAHEGGTPLPQGEPT